MHETAHEIGRIAVTQAGYLWLIPLFPLVGAAINALVGWKLQQLFGKKIVHRIAVTAMFAAFAVAVRAFFQMVQLPGEERFLQDTLWNLLTAGRLSVDLGFALDPLSMLMVLIITGIGALLHVFSFWYTDPEKAKAGMKAFVANRFGDFGFLAGLFLLFWALGGAWQPRAGNALRNTDYQPAVEATVAGATSAAQADALAPRVDGVKVGPTMNFRELRDQVVIEATGVKEHLLGSTVWGISILTLIGMLLFVGAMGKSAQIPLYVWLPDAMAGPTPVSALIHAATMVTAGVYMVARLNFLFALSYSAMGWVALIGAATAIFAASIGFFQYDIKKVLAYSTVSQLGFMFIGVGVGRSEERRVG